MSRACPGVGITDFSTFYRGYRVGIVRQVMRRHGDRIPAGRGFESYARFLVEAASLADRIEEVPARLDYRRKRGASKMRLAGTIVGYLRVAAGAWIRSSPFGRLGLR